MKRALMAIVLGGWALCASASNFRQETLQACTRQATDQALSGDAYAEFMRSCLKAPRDAKPPVYAASAAAKLAPGQAVRPAIQARIPTNIFQRCSFCFLAWYRAWSAWPIKVRTLVMLSA